MEAKKRRLQIENLDPRLCLTGDFLSADFNGDNRLDALDIDLINAAVFDQSSDGVFDLSGNGVVDGRDVDYLVADLLGTRRGDADLDGDVDFVDFLALANGFGQEGGWANGNFGSSDRNANASTVSFLDFVTLANNFGFERTQTTLTHQQPDGNRFVEGWGDIENATAVDIDLPFIPDWVVGTQIEDRQLWVVVGRTGQVAAYELDGTEVGSVLFNPTMLPQSIPIVLEATNSTGPKISPVIEDASTLTHPIRFGNDLEKTAYIRNDGAIVVLHEDGPEDEALVNAMLDARILSDGNGRLMLLTEPTGEVPHGVLGNAVEADRITIVDTNTSPLTITHVDTPEGQVVEGIAPIWIDVDGDGDREIIVTLSSIRNGGQITVFEETGDISAQGPGIGRAWRWRHQLAVAPFGPNGELEFVDVLTPHLGRVVEFRSLDDTLTIVGEQAGYTSHVNGSPNLDMAVAGDFDSDGTVELLLPDSARTTLGAISRDSSESGAGLDWSVPLGSRATTNIGVLRSHDGRLSVAVGTLNQSLRIFVDPIAASQ